MKAPWRCASRPWPRRCRSGASSRACASSSSGRAPDRDVAQAREADLDLAVFDEPIPGGRPRSPQARHGHGPLGPVRAARAAGQRRRADEPSRDRRLRSRTSRAAQIERFEAATADRPNVIRHIANSAAALRIPESHFDAARCGVALYGMSPFGEPPAVDGLEPALRWESYLAQVRQLAPGREHGVREGLRRAGADLDRPRARRATRTVSAGT